MNSEYYKKLEKDCLKGKAPSKASCLEILKSPKIDLLDLIRAAFEIRKHYWNKTVKIHILNNVQNGLCSEDCSYCAQSQKSESPIERYSLKTDEEILSEARNAYEKGAFRYCMVFSGKGPSDERIEHLCELVRTIKSQYPIEVCVSAGILTKAQAQKLKKAGLDRMNHNINTSEKQYAKICSTHTYQDRLDTLNYAHEVELQVCSGVIIGMGESHDDVLDMALQLRSISAESIPVNFFIPIPGVAVHPPKNLTPEYCLRVLCLFRLLNPQSEIRVAAGRELHLRGMEVLSLYPANSLFLDGYLNVKGSSRLKTLQMIKDAGFEIESDKTLDEILAKEQNFIKDNLDSSTLKNIGELRPNLSKP